MSFQLIYTDSYIKRAKKFFKNNPSLLLPYEKTLVMLEINPYHPSLRIHELKGKLNDLYSISINTTYRLTMELILTDNEIILVNIGHHDKIY